jgi:cystathionine beta-lyase
MDYGLASCIQKALADATEECALGHIPEPWKRLVAQACADWQQRHAIAAGMSSGLHPPDSRRA